ncbi:MAG: NINE protein, partial [Anaerolineales bacterium]
MFQSTEQIQPTDPPKNELVAALLSLFILGGVGQMYLGQTKKGIILVVATIVTYCLGLGWI